MWVWVCVGVDLGEGEEEEIVGESLCACEGGEMEEEGERYIEGKRERRQYNVTEIKEREKKGKENRKRKERKKGRREREKGAKI